MDNTRFTADRKNISRSQKAWKFIRDVNDIALQDLRKVAVRDGSREYTYGLMFREWDRYASVFSSLKMTGENSARVGILGSTCAEVIFSFYGLNMVGADVSVIPTYSSLTPKKILNTIRSENLTDFIVTDDFAQSNLINDLLVQKKELGLRNVIVLHVPVTGVTVSPMLTAAQEAKYKYLKSLYGPVCMDELLAAYGNHPVSYAPKDSRDTALILHTSGTTSGAGKPVALSDTAMNAAAAIFYGMNELRLPWGNLVTAVIVDLSNAYSMIDQVHLPFAMGATVVVAPGGVLNPWFYKAIPQYSITFLFTISAMFERWIKMPDQKGLDFSSLQFVALGGAAVSAADKRRYRTFMQEHGAGDVTILNGYGISELGGACILSTPDIDDESIGYPLPEVLVRLKDEESGAFRSIADAPCEGVLYVNSPAIASPELDGNSVLESETAEGLPYICTNDLVRMEADGRLTFLGRANRYFINDAGRKYESGRVETEFARQPGIESCCVVPVYIKTTHDNIPMLCVKTVNEAADPKETVLHALRGIFLVERTLSEDNLPLRIMIAEELPRNGNGKIDLYKISRGEAEGEVFTLDAVRKHGTLTDFRLTPYEEGPADMIKEVFDGISEELKDSMPFRSHISNNNSKEGNDMKNAKKAFENFNAMNQMGKQMMTNMMNRMGQGQNFSGAPFCGMPDMQKMMTEMQKMNQKAAAMIPGIQGAAKNMAKEMVPAMQEQMNYMMGCMQQMNQMALEMMQKTFEQNCMMMNKMFDTMQKMADAPAPVKTAEAAAEPEEAEPAEEAAAPKKRTRKSKKD